MRRLLVYSHDTFGLGNIRRVLAICERGAAGQIDSILDAISILISGKLTSVGRAKKMARLKRARENY